MVPFGPEYYRRGGYRAFASSVSTSFLEILLLNISSNLTQTAHLSSQKNSVLKHPKLRKTVFHICYNGISQIFHGNQAPKHP